MLWVGVGGMSGWGMMWVGVGGVCCKWQGWYVWEGYVVGGVGGM